MKKTNLILFILITLIFVNGVIVLINKIGEKDELKEIFLENGNHFFTDDLVINENEILIIKPGAILNFDENKKILIKGKIIAKGTEENPITFKSSGDYFWHGIEIQGQNSKINQEKYWEWLKSGNAETQRDFFEKIEKGNIFNYCYFLDISNKEKKLTEESRWIGAVESYNSSLMVVNSTFENIKHLGGIVTQKSYSVIKNNNFFSDEIHKQINTTNNSISLIYNNRIIVERKEKQGCADGIWVVNSTALIYSNIITGVADDGINATRSYTIIGNNNISKTLDEGIDIESIQSIGESIVFNNLINKAETGGIKLTGSKSIIANNEIKNSKAGLILRNGSTALVSKITIENNDNGILVFNSIPCALNENDFLKVKNNILTFLEEKNCSEICPNSLCLPDSKRFTKEELVETLEENYVEINGYYVYDKNYLHRTIGDIFQKIINIAELNPLTNNEIKEKASFCFSFQNSLFLEESDYNKNNTTELVLNDFNFKMSNNIDNYQCSSQINDFLCDFKNKREKLYFDNLTKNINSIIKLF